MSAMAPIHLRVRASPDCGGKSSNGIISLNVFSSILASIINELFDPFSCADDADVIVELALLRPLPTNCAVIIGKLMSNDEEDEEDVDMRCVYSIDVCR